MSEHLDKTNGAAARPQETLDAVIVGAGFAGLYMLHLMRRQGLDGRIIEAGGGVGGTWYWNRYPGARCDVQSMEYSYQFCPELEQEWEWSERYATQSEILRYADHVADRFGLKSDIRFKLPRHRRKFRQKCGILAGRDRRRRLHRGAFCRHGDRVPVLDQHTRHQGPGYV